MPNCLTMAICTTVVLITSLIHTRGYRHDREIDQVELKRENEYIPITEYILSFKDSSS